MDRHECRQPFNEQMFTSTSGGGIAVWLNKDTTLRIDWHPALGLHTLFSEALADYIGVTSSKPSSPMLRPWWTRSRAHDRHRGHCDRPDASRMGRPACRATAQASWPAKGSTALRAVTWTSRWHVRVMPCRTRGRGILMLQSGESACDPDTSPADATE